MEKPLILISNDDGIEAKGIKALASMVSDLGDVMVCAPAGPQSGKSRAFSLDRLTYKTTDREGWYVCTGTPVDCIKMACGLMKGRQPDLVLGGINHGDNASTNAHYSGTIGVAFEGCMKGIPSIAFSLCDYDPDANFEPMRPIVRKLCQHVLEHGLPTYTCLNVNVPKVQSDDELKGVRICRMAHGRWRKEVELDGAEVADANDQGYLLRGYYQSDEPDATDTDAWAIRNGYAAVTPCTIDITDYPLLSQLKEITAND